jgi:hypothetical protein
LFACLFESRVISDGSQTVVFTVDDDDLFESRVISDGSQTISPRLRQSFLFESRVISDGSQTQVFTCSRVRMFAHLVGPTRFLRRSEQRLASTVSDHP